MTRWIVRPELRKTAFRISAILATFAVSSLLLVTCHRRSFIDELACGMTKDEVTRLARAHGYDPSDPHWLTRAAKDKERTLVDLTFHDGRLVAVREGTYDPRTKRVVYRTVDLCAR